MNFYFGQDKQEMDDEWPVMIKDRKSGAFFHTQNYFFNQDELLSGDSAIAQDDVVAKKQKTIDTMLLAAKELEDADEEQHTTSARETSARNTRNDKARAYNTALEAYLKVFPKVQV